MAMAETSRRLHDRGIMKSGETLVKCADAVIQERNGTFYCCIPATPANHFEIEEGEEVPVFADFERERVVIDLGDE